MKPSNSAEHNSKKSAYTPQNTHPQLCNRHANTNATHYLTSPFLSIFTSRHCSLFMGPATENVPNKKQNVETIPISKGPLLNWSKGQSRSHSSIFHVTPSNPCVICVPAAYNSLTILHKSSLSKNTVGAHFTKGKTKIFCKIKINN